MFHSETLNLQNKNCEVFEFLYVFSEPYAGFPYFSTSQLIQSLSLLLNSSNQRPVLRTRIFGFLTLVPMYRDAAWYLSLFYFTQCDVSGFAANREFNYYFFLAYIVSIHHTFSIHSSENRHFD